MFVLNCFIGDDFKQTEMFPKITEAMQKAQNFANEFDNFQIHVSEGRVRSFMRGTSYAEGQRVRWNEEYYGETAKVLPGRNIVDFMADEGILMC